MSGRKLAARLREAQGRLDGGVREFKPRYATEDPYKWSYICHAIQLGVYGQECPGAFITDPELPEIKLLVEMGMGLGGSQFSAWSVFDSVEQRQGTRFMVLEMAALLAEDTP